MRVNKKVFWVSFLAILISIIGISIFTPLYLKYKIEVYLIFENIFISLVGGSCLSMVIAFIGFNSTKKHYIIRFNSEYIILTNKIKNLHNWFTWKYNDIKYYNLSDLDKELTEQQKEDFINTSDKNNNEKVKQFYNIVKSISSYNFDNFYEIIDDFCSLQIKKKSSYWIMMKEMLELINKYNVGYLKSIHFAGYETGFYNEYILFENLCPIYLKIIKEYPIEKFAKKQAEFLKLTNINKYLEALYKNQEKTNEI